MITEACEAGVRQQAACQILGISAKTLQRWQTLDSLEDKRTKRKSPPHNKLSIQEQKKILSVVNEPRYSEMSPAKIVPLLADQGKYIASESTMYRLLKAKSQLKHRHASTS